MNQEPIYNSFPHFLETIGMHGNNIKRLTVALDQLHMNVSKMDSDQLELLKRTAIGRHIIASISLYAQVQRGLRHQF